MEEYTAYFPMKEYPISNIPLDVKDYIKIYKSAFQFISFLQAEPFIKMGSVLYQIVFDQFSEYVDYQRRIKATFQLGKKRY